MAAVRIEVAYLQPLDAKVTLVCQTARCAVLDDLDGAQGEGCGAIGTSALGLMGNSVGVGHGPDDPHWGTVALPLVAFLGRDLGWAALEVDSWTWGAVCQVPSNSS